MDHQADLVHTANKGVVPHCNRRVALIECEDAEKWEGYTETLWKEALHEAGDCWTLFQACAGDLPLPAEAATFDAIVIGGSHYSAYEQHDWINKMLELLPQYVAQGARIYGCCFGCQILARALGGSVGSNPDGNFVLTLEQVQPTPELQQLTELHQLVQQALADVCALNSNSSSCSNSDTVATAVQSAAAAVDERPKSSSASITVGTAAGDNTAVNGLHEVQLACGRGCFRLMESHGDQVLSLPPGAIRLATSPTAVNELWCYGPNVLASQFHVEFDEPLVLEKIWRTLKDTGRLDECQAEQSRRVLEAGGQQNAGMLQVIKHFLKHGLSFAGAQHTINSNHMSSRHSCSGGGGEGTGDDAAHSTQPSETGVRNTSSTSSKPAAGGNGSDSSGSLEPEGSGCGEQSLQGHIQQQEQQQQHLDDTAAADFSGTSVSAAAAEGVGYRSPAVCPTVLAAAVDSLPIPGDASGRSDATHVAAPGAVPAVEPRSSSPQGSILCDQLDGQHIDKSFDSSSGAGGLTPVIPLLSHGALAGDLSAALASGASSPTALSDRSVTTAASTSSTVPFSQIAYQRRQQQREEGLVESSQQLVDAAAAAFDIRMECYNLDLETLQQLNDAAAEQYSSTAEIATALCQFVTDLETRQAAAREALAILPQLDRQLKLLENAVGLLDRRSKDLESRIGLGRSSAYDYLTSTLGKAGSSVSAAAYYATGQGTCLGGSAAPKQ